MVEYPVVVWDVNCEHAGSFSVFKDGGKRFCKKKKEWMSFEECYYCKERD